MHCWCHLEVNTIANWTKNTKTQAEASPVEFDKAVIRCMTAMKLVATPRVIPNLLHQYQCFNVFAWRGGQLLASRTAHREARAESPYALVFTWGITYPTPSDLSGYLDTTRCFIFCATRWGARSISAMWSIIRTHLCF